MSMNSVPGSTPTTSPTSMPTPQPSPGIQVNDKNSTGFVAMIAEKFSEMSNSTMQFVGQVSDSIKGKLSETVGKGTFIGDNYIALANLINDHALNLGYAGAAIGGLTVVNSTINLLQKKADDHMLFPKKDTTPKGEALKILFGSAMIGLSAVYAAKDSLETSKIINVALGSGLLNAAWRACIVVKPTALTFNLKSFEGNEQVVAAFKNLIVFSE